MVIAPLGGDELCEGDDDAVLLGSTHCVARLHVKGESGKPRNGLSHRLFTVGEIPALDSSLLPLVGGRAGAITDARGMCQKVASDDRSMKCLRVV